MSIRVPPTLSYLTIYNPTLRPLESNVDIDEDAEEQAHILFYTSRERAVSRDKMLRQVGLAKALISFSEQFNESVLCGNVHSQSRRLVTVSPEPNFWVHAAIEVAKTPQHPMDKEKEKHKAKGKEKDKAEKRTGKGNGDQQDKEAPIMYDFHDGSVDSLAVRASIISGYEQFKLTHGSFTRILSNLGKEALELQLERFFTVWAWSWDLEDGLEFGPHLGVPLHPYHHSLIPLLDEFLSKLREDICAILIAHPHVVPSTRYTDAQYPPALSRHLLSLIPPRHSPTTIHADDNDSQHTQTAIDHQLSGHPQMSSPTDAIPSQVARDTSTILGLPAMRVNIKPDLDVRKWSWPGYLTFRKNSVRNASELPSVVQERKQTRSQEEVEKQDAKDAVDVDVKVLEDAMSSHKVPFPTVSNSQPITAVETANECPHNSVALKPEPSSLSSADGFSGEETASQVVGVVCPATEPVEGVLASPFIPEFLIKTVHLADRHDALATSRRKLFYITNKDLAVALIGSTDNDPDVHSWAEPTFALINDLRNTIEEETLSGVSESLPSAAKILEPSDKYIIHRTNFTMSSPGFTSKSEHLYQAQLWLEREPDVNEVFSRGQNPQHWHIARRGLGVDKTGSGGELDGEIYVEVSRKETSLTEVDNVISGVVKKFLN